MYKIFSFSEFINEEESTGSTGASGPSSLNPEDKKFNSMNSILKEEFKKDSVVSMPDKEEIKISIDALPKPSAQIQKDYLEMWIQGESPKSKEKTFLQIIYGDKPKVSEVVKKSDRTFDLNKLGTPNSGAVILSGESDEVISVYSQKDLESSSDSKRWKSVFNKLAKI